MEGAGALPGLESGDYLGVSTSSSTWQPVQRLGDRCLLRWVQGPGFDSLCLANKERSQGLGI